MILPCAVGRPHPHVEPAGGRAAVRFLRRLDLPDHNWKSSANHARERDYCDDYQQAISEMLSNTSTVWAPWHVIPADRKWFTRICVLAVLAHTVIEPDPKYPKASPAQRLEERNAKAELLAQAPNDAVADPCQGSASAAKQPRPEDARVTHERQEGQEVLSAGSLLSAPADLGRGDGPLANDQQRTRRALKDMTRGECTTLFEALLPGDRDEIGAGLGRLGEDHLTDVASPHVDPVAAAVRAAREPHLKLALPRRHVVVGTVNESRGGHAARLQRPGTGDDV